MPSHIGVCTFDRNGHLVYADRTFDKVIPPDLRVSGPIWDSAQNPRQLRAEFAECLFTGESVTTETAVNVPDGNLRLVHSYHRLPENCEHAIACAFHEPLRSEPLSPQELDCLREISDGHNIGEVAAKLDVSEGTVKNALYRARAKLLARNNEQAVKVAVRCGLL